MNRKISNKASSIAAGVIASLLLALPSSAQNQETERQGTELYTFEQEGRYGEQVASQPWYGFSMEEWKMLQERTAGLSSFERMRFNRIMNDLLPSERQLLLKLIQGGGSTASAADPTIAAVVVEPVVVKPGVVVEPYGTGKMEYREIVGAWPEKSRDAATTIIARYGAPDEATPTRLIWNNRGQWRRTIVYRDPVPHNFPMPHYDLIEQFIDYPVPADKFDELARFDGSVTAERTRGELSSRCDKEAANVLALNLAHEIITGQRSVEEARKFYAETIQQLMAGETPAYTSRFVFQLPGNNTSDPGQPASR